MINSIIIGRVILVEQLVRREFRQSRRRVESCMVSVGQRRAGTCAAAYQVQIGVRRQIGVALREGSPEWARLAMDSAMSPDVQDRRCLW